MYSKRSSRSPDEETFAHLIEFQTYLDLCNGGRFYPPLLDVIAGRYAVVQVRQFRHLLVRTFKHPSDTIICQLQRRLYYEIYEYMYDITLFPISVVHFTHSYSSILPHMPEYPTSYAYTFYISLGGFENSNPYLKDSKFQNLKHHTSWMIRRRRAGVDTSSKSDGKRPRYFRRKFLAGLSFSELS